MTHYADAALVPLESDAQVQQRVDELVGRACRRQLWFLFVDERGVQLPAIVPVPDIPITPPDPAVLAHMVGGIADSADASAVILVIERFAAEALTDADRGWANALHTACSDATVPLRALLLSHRDGVRWLAPDDYRF